MKNFGGMPNMNQLMKQAQKMQRKMEEVQQALETAEMTATAGGGMVEVVVTGKKQVKSITIKPEVVDPDDIETLEDLVTAAVNEAMRQAEEYSQREMGKVTGGLPTGGLF
jgi:DNA-binding YbaB/EbfC family protein